jgi:glycosyltransferase involved in cell wall biosynthesis
MNILMLVPAPEARGPVAKHAPLLVDGLRQVGCTVVTESWGRRNERDGAFARAIDRLRDIARIRRRLRSGDFDVLVVKTSHEWVSMLRDIPLLAATRRSVPCSVLQFHGGETQRLAEPRPTLFKAATSAEFRLSDGVLVLSSEEQRLAKAFRPQGRFHMVANPFLPPLAAAQQRENGPGTLLFASRLVAAKGIFDVLAALKLLREKLPSRLVVAGSGPEEAAVAERVRDLRLTDAVTLAGHLAGDELSAAFGSADIFVLPTYWPEGFPTAITEAMSAGLPIVTTATRGIADHLEDGFNALFVPAHDPQAIADAITILLEDPDLRERMAAANRAKVAEFAPDRVAGEYLEALERITAAKGAGQAG